MGQLCSCDSIYVLVDGANEYKLAQYVVQTQEPEQRDDNSVNAPEGVVGG